ncbi:MAG: outer membrane lipoprotein carrier protein LolA [Gammaproteobacteria bacterium]|nr:MAG: outer membrane lipoprotein carrier protein LolA [Gammaproteobacteria bacterium]
MFKKNLLFISLFSVLNFSAFADEVNPKVAVERQVAVNQLVTVKSPQKLALVKQALMQKVAQLSAFSASFTQKVVDADGNSIQENSGNLAVAKPNLLHWQVNEPNESLIISDGKALWLYDPFIEQVSVYATDGAITNTPILLLANPDKSIWQNYDVKLLKKNHYLILSKDENSQVKSLELVFNESDENSHSSLNEFVILDATGQLSRVFLSQVKTLNADNSQLFTFIPPNGVEVDDQR